MFKNQIQTDTRSPPHLDKKAPQGWLSHNSPAREHLKESKSLRGIFVSILKEIFDEVKKFLCEGE